MFSSKDWKAKIYSIENKINEFSMVSGYKINDGKSILMTIGIPVSVENQIQAMTAALVEIRSNAVFSGEYLFVSFRFS